MEIQMTNEEVFLKAVEAMRLICNSAAEGNAYNTHWGKEFRCEDLDRRFMQVRSLEPFNSEEFWRRVFALSESQKYYLGFSKWQAEDKEMCIPIWIWQLLPESMEIQGAPKSGLDNDTRFGCVWWKA